jgi:hypothetical protein
MALGAHRSDPRVSLPERVLEAGDASDQITLERTRHDARLILDINAEMCRRQELLHYETS